MEINRNDFYNCLECFANSQVDNEIFNRYRNNFVRADDRFEDEREYRWVLIQGLEINFSLELERIESYNLLAVFENNEFLEISFDNSRRIHVFLSNIFKSNLPPSLSISYLGKNGTKNIEIVKNKIKRYSPEYREHSVFELRGSMQLEILFNEADIKTIKIENNSNIESIHIINNPLGSKIFVDQIEISDMKKLQNLKLQGPISLFKLIMKNNVMKNINIDFDENNLNVMEIHDIILINNILCKTEDGIDYLKELVFYRRLKNYFLKKRNMISADYVYALELEKYRESLNKKNFWEKKNLVDTTDYFILTFSLWLSGHRRIIWLPMVWLLFLAFITIYLVCLPNNLGINNQWILLIPGSLIWILKDAPQIGFGWSLFIVLIQTLSIILYYEIVVVARKFVSKN